MVANRAQRSNYSFPYGFVPGVSSRTTSQAERVVPIDPTGWAESNRDIVLCQNGFLVPPAEGQQFGHTVYIDPAGAIHVVSADRDESHFTISQPAEFKVEIRDVRIGEGAVLRRNEPLTLRAAQCGPDGLYRADVPGLGTPIAAFSREEMIDALTDLLAHLWKEYALENDANLKPRAQRLKACLLRDYTVVR